MASTSNKNTQSDYCLQQQLFERNINYNLYPNSQYGSSYQAAIPNKCVGIPKFSMNERATNGIDVESELKGIGSTNLVKPRGRFIPNPHLLPNICFFNQPSTQLPNPVVVQKNQRYGIYE